MNMNVNLYGDIELCTSQGNQISIITCLHIYKKFLFTFHIKTKQELFLEPKPENVCAGEYSLIFSPLRTKSYFDEINQNTNVFDGIFGLDRKFNPHYFPMPWKSNNPPVDFCLWLFCVC